MMMNPRFHRAAILVACAFFVAACSGDDHTAASSVPPTSSASLNTEPNPTRPPQSTEVPSTSAVTTTRPERPGDWTVPLGGCPDPVMAGAPLGDTINIASVMPLTGGVAAAYVPVAEGFQLYIDVANAKALVPRHTLELAIEDDQRNPDLTPDAVRKLLFEHADLFAGIIGTANNLAVRPLLNDACVPQLLAASGSPAWGDVARFPWTTGQSVPYTVEAGTYVAQIRLRHPNGARVATFAVDSEFGIAFHDAFASAADVPGLDLVTDQTVAADDPNAPTQQVAAIADAEPDAIMAVPQGAGCGSFLKELAATEAARPRWRPDVYLTNTCASRLFLQFLAGDAGIGTFTSSNTVDILDPLVADLPGMRAFNEAYTAAGLQGDRSTTSVGWTLGEITVAILDKALESGTLSRASIIEAARSLHFVPSLARAGVAYTMNGASDAYPFESLQVLQWNGTTFDDVGELVTDFEGTTSYSG
jgi:branched-chain amino acid transport system substrate-binding protein